MLNNFIIGAHRKTLTFIFVILIVYMTKRNVLSKHPWGTPVEILRGIKWSMFSETVKLLILVINVLSIADF